MAISNFERFLTVIVLSFGFELLWPPVNDLTSRPNDTYPVIYSGLQAFTIAFWLICHNFA